MILCVMFLHEYLVCKLTSPGQSAFVKQPSMCTCKIILDASRALCVHMIPTNSTNAIGQHIRHFVNQCKLYCIRKELAHKRWPNFCLLAMTCKYRCTGSCASQLCPSTFWITSMTYLHNLSCLAILLKHWSSTCHLVLGSHHGVLLSGLSQQCNLSQSVFVHVMASICVKMMAGAYLP